MLRATGTQEIESERCRDRDVELPYSVVRHVYHGASSRRDRELNYSSQPIAKNQATMTPKAWISTGDSSLCGHLLKTLKLMAYDSTVDTKAQKLCEGVLVQKDDTAVAKRQTGWQSKTQGL